jgi:hypothetical protein
MHVPTAMSQVWVPQSVVLATGQQKLGMSTSTEQALSKGGLHWSWVFPEQWYPSSKPASAHAFPPHTYLHVLVALWQLWNSAHCWPGQHGC